jgi:hypothetical protein
MESRGYCSVPDNELTDVASGGVSLANPLLHMGLAAYLAASLSQVEDALLNRDVALHAGDDDNARDLEERAAGLACVALTRATDEFQVPAAVSMEQSYSNFLRTQEPIPGVTMDEFRTKEIHLLRLAGLSQELAARHFDGALDAFRLSPISIRSAEELQQALEAGAYAACGTHELLVRARRAAEGTRRRRRRLRRVLTALGGTVITVANSLAVPLIGPVAVGVSMVLGAGAAGAAANIFED